MANPGMPNRQVGPGAMPGSASSGTMPGFKAGTGGPPTSGNWDGITIGFGGRPGGVPTHITMPSSPAAGLASAASILAKVSGVPVTIDPVGAFNRAVKRVAQRIGNR